MNLNDAMDNFFSYIIISIFHPFIPFNSISLLLILLIQKRRGIGDRKEIRR